MSTCIIEARKLFQKFDTAGKGYMTRGQFRDGYNRFFTPSDDGTVDRLVASLDPRNQDRIDYIEWSNTIRLEDIPALTR
jgi:Ca2+-binding EF-hand superfamily protein